MLKISKLTDYGTVVMTWLASKPDSVHSAAEVAEATRLSAPTVSKLLKMLAMKGLVSSTRGTKGGYSLSRPAAEISIADVICAIEGPVSLTACSDPQRECEQQDHCGAASAWQRINRVVHSALKDLSLADMQSDSGPDCAGPDSRTDSDSVAVSVLMHAAS